MKRIWRAWIHMSILDKIYFGCNITPDGIKWKAITPHCVIYASCQFTSRLSASFLLKIKYTFVENIGKIIGNGTKCLAS